MHLHGIPDKTFPPTFTSKEYVNSIHSITKKLLYSVGQFFHPWFEFCEVGRESRHHVHVSTTQSV